MSFDLFKFWIPAINEKKNDPFSDGKNDIQSLEKDYPSFMINRALSQSKDCILQVNEVNIRTNHMPPQWQFDFLYETIPKRKRFEKWAKAEKSEEIDLVKRVYGYSQKKAEAVINLFTESDFENMREWVFEGGKK